MTTTTARRRRRENKQAPMTTMTCANDGRAEREVAVVRSACSLNTKVCPIFTGQSTVFRRPKKDDARVSSRLHVKSITSPPPPLSWWTISTSSGSPIGMRTRGARPGFTLLSAYRFPSSSSKTTSRLVNAFSGFGGAFGGMRNLSPWRYSSRTRPSTMSFAARNACWTSAKATGTARFVIARVHATYHKLKSSPQSFHSNWPSPVRRSMLNRASAPCKSSSTTTFGHSAPFAECTVANTSSAFSSLTSA
mmetsp:Transcript_12091/g.50620  ORF Transcript_12091/g.50620 Transcript_12091/m.50620 type:complete len:249 (+) Transcript_12091:623-1369(+)